MATSKLQVFANPEKPDRVTFELRDRAIFEVRVSRLDPHALEVRCIEHISMAHDATLSIQPDGSNMITIRQRRKP